jgi:GT2 family glycosyltransferase
MPAPPIPPTTIALITATLGRPRQLADLFADVQAQTTHDLTWIVVTQDPAPSFTPASPKHWATWDTNARYPMLEGFRRIVQVHIPWQRGLAAARNLGVAVAWGLGCRYIAYADDDDRMGESYCARLGAALDAHPKASVAACWIGDRGQALDPRTHYSSCSRMARIEACATRPWMPTGPAMDTTYWRQFDDLETVVVESEPLYVCGNAPTGGTRDVTGAW